MKLRLKEKPNQRDKIYMSLSAETCGKLSDGKSVKVCCTASTLPFILAEVVEEDVIDRIRNELRALAPTDDVYI